MSVVIRLQNLPLSAAASDVRQFFGGLKIPDGAVHIVGGPQGDVFVGFASDDDARQAMRRDRMQIHNEEIRLYLSSKTEMNDVIEKAKSGIFPQSQPFSQNTWKTPSLEPPRNNGNPYAARPDYTSSYPPQHVTNSYPPVQQPPLMSQNFSNNFNDRQQPQQHQFRRSPPIRENGGYSGLRQNEGYENGRGNRDGNNRFQRGDRRGEDSREKERLQREKDRIARHKQREEREKNERRRFEKSPIRESKPQNSTATPFSVFPPPMSFPNELKPEEPSVSESWRTGGEEKKPILIVQPPNIGPDGLLRPGLPDQKYYIEMTRLPNELLSAVKLEEFIAPTIPLTLSSAKTVYGPGGVHIQTFVRLEDQEDFFRMLRRDGETGIKIRRASKKDFDDANDGIANILEEDRMRRRGGRSRRSRSPRRVRSRSPRRRPSPRRRQRSDSRVRKEQMKTHKDPTRWCVQVTNVPFRCKEEELLEWFCSKVKPAKLIRTFYADGNASDRWIAEFSSESLFDRAFSIRTNLQGRSLRLDYIDNNKADEILKIEDIYGTEKRSASEAKREALNEEPLKFFNHTTTTTTTPHAKPIAEVAPVVPQTSPLAAPAGLPPQLPPPHNVPPRMIHNGPPPQAAAPHIYPAGPPPPHRSLLPPPPQRSVPPMPRPPPQHFRQNPDFYPPPHGSFFNTGPMPRKPMPPMGRMPPARNGAGPFNKFNNGSFPPNGQPFSPEHLMNDAKRKGTVLSCTGFPENVTLEDVIDLFKDFEPDTNSVLIRRSETGKMTGECMLSCATPDKAADAAIEMNGHIIHGSKISVSVLNQ